MAVYKEEKTNTWRAVYRYTDWNSERKQTQKRGFKTKREAQAWEREQLNKTSVDLDMTFKSFVDLYTADMKTRLKENTWAILHHPEGVDLMPADIQLSGMEVSLVNAMSRETILLQYLDTVKGQYSHTCAGPMCWWSAATASTRP
ncbi:Arm DNA-binding domain-containing protein [Intestinimonas timonensis]|uniref:Arm DNA-binding domain-containing protein n=1 Tax=Intestinimonas timonensis TaxID=1689270 RepID=UPI0030FF3E09